MQNSINYNQIIKDCFWDYNIDENDISEILNSDDLRRKQKLFSKIIYNSTDKARTLKILFDKETLQQLFATFTASYNKKYIDKYILVLKNILLDENNYIESLAWKKR
jgi:hypothetical protein